jgi:uncharacterized SAM-binding protein YcdF (DUF218 family)
VIRGLIIAVVAVTLAIVGISIYLQPDDLAGCNDVVGTQSKCRTVDAIVAVSGGDTQARTNEAIKLYQNGWAPKLIFSGAAEDKSGPSNAAAMETIALKDGVPTSAIELDEYSNTTKQNAEDSETIFKKDNIQSVILVTSGYHERRASLEFNKRTFNVLVLDHPAPNDQDWSFWWWATPTGWYLAISELAKIVAFYLGFSS